MNRDDFSMLDQNIIYFDNGATTFKPKCVVYGINGYYNNYSANAHRGDYDISYKTDVSYEGAREKVSKFINANSKEIVFTSGATESINLVVNGLCSNLLKKDDEVLITYAEHASNVLPWFKLAKTNGVCVNYIELDENHSVSLENVKKAITEKTKVISLAHVTNVIGDIRSIKEICEIAHQKGIIVIVDAAQSIGHIKTDVKDLDCDFLCFSGHKMMGPTGIGVLYGKEELLNQIDPVNLGGGMNESFDSYNEVYLKEIPNRLEAGTPNIAGAIGLGFAIDYINKVGIEVIHEHELELKKYFMMRVKEIPFIKVVNENTNTGIVSFTVDDIFPQDVSYYLNKYNICVRAGNHCAKILKNEIGIKNTIRISFYLYNTYEEIDTFIDVMKDKEKIIREMI